MMLNSRWQKAIWMLLNFMTAKAARMEVQVAPMLAPRVMGNILCTGRTPMPTRGVKADVVTELDCTMMVITRPSNMAR